MRTVEALDSTVGREQRLLDQILGIGVVPRERESEPDEDFVLGEHEARKQVAAPRLLRRILHARETLLAADRFQGMHAGGQRASFCDAPRPTTLALPPGARVSD